eukprot:1813921-Rhodomonas_salina.1
MPTSSFRYAVTTTTPTSWVTYPWPTRPLGKAKVGRSGATPSPWPSRITSTTRIRSTTTTIKP